MADQGTTQAQSETQVNSVSTQTETKGNSGSTAPESKDIPYARFQEVVSERNNLKSQVESFQSKLEAEIASRLEKVKSDLELGWQAKESSWQEERALLRAGLQDDEAMDAARFAWSRVPADARPEGGISAWLTDIRENSDKMPKILQPFFTQVQPTQPAAPKLPGPAATSGRPAVATGPVTPEALKAAFERYRRTGDRTEYTALEAAVFRQT